MAKNKTDQKNPNPNYVRKIFPKHDKKVVDLTYCTFVQIDKESLWSWQIIGQKNIKKENEFSRPKI